MKKRNFKNYHNVYDFDKTIYAGDCSIDFYIFAIKRNPKILKYLPFQFSHWILYLLKIENKSEFKGNYFIFIKELYPIDVYVGEFWDNKFSNIKEWYLKNKSNTDIIISASPSFLLSDIIKRLGVHTLIATNLNIKTGKLLGNNCYGAEKLKRLQKEIPNIKIKEAYSDSYSDSPILDLAERAYIVKGNKLVHYKSRRS